MLNRSSPLSYKLRYALGVPKTFGTDCLLIHEINFRRKRKCFYVKIMSLTEQVLKLKKCQMHTHPITKPDSKLVQKTVDVLFLFL